MSITTSVKVRYQVAAYPECEELQVLDELLDEEGWDDQTPATCEACGWRGAVASLQRPVRKRPKARRGRL